MNNGHKDWGEIEVVIPEPKPLPYIPAQLRQFAVVDSEGSIDRLTAIDRYGLWELEALEDFRCCGREVKTGDRFKVSGNVAIFLLQEGRAQLANEPRVKEQEKLFQEAKRLGLPQSLKELASFVPKTTKK